ncbi:MAG TPA: FG-GAP-like repeat-containing protein, partial [Planctomycetota bacterium]|nr:FG-GAP-like repeat-containing protein [Planctomycetota bacterium]
SPPAVVASGAFLLDLRAGDVDGDGDREAISLTSGATSTSTVSVHAARGGGAFLTTSFVLPIGNRLAVGDVDGDGDADLVGQSQTFFSAGGTFLPGPSLTPPLAASATLADVDDDGVLDLVETPATLRLGLGGGAFGPPVVAGAPVPIGPSQAWLSSQRPRVVDLDQDGDLDVVAPGPRVYLDAMRQVANRGTVLLGAPSTLDLYGPPGGGFALFASLAASEWPTPFGTALIEPTVATLIANGAFASGPGWPQRTSWTFAVPSTPALVGASLYWQSFDAAASRLTNLATSTVSAR